MEHYREHGLEPGLPDLDLQWTGTVHMTSQMDLKEIAEVVDVPLEMISFLNPGLKKAYVPTLTYGYDLVLPKRVIGVFQSYLLTMERPENRLQYRTIEWLLEQRESVYDIAARFDVDVHLFKSWNHLAHDLVEAGQRVLVHEVFDPMQVNEEPERSVAHEKMLGRVMPLPKVIDHKLSFQGAYLRQLEVDREIFDFDMRRNMPYLPLVSIY